MSTARTGSISVPSPTGPPARRPPVSPLPFPLLIACVDLHAILLVVSIATTTKWPKDNRGAPGAGGRAPGGVLTLKMNPIPPHAWHGVAALPSLHHSRPLVSLTQGPGPHLLRGRGGSVLKGAGGGRGGGESIHPGQPEPSGSVSILMMKMSAQGLPRPPCLPPPLLHPFFWGLFRKRHKA